MLDRRQAHRCLILIVSLVVLLSPVAGAQTAAPAAPSPFAGHWEGAIQIPTGELQVMMDLTPAEGGWKGSIDIPQQGAKGLPLDKITVDGDHARFSIAGVPGDPTFDGEAKNGAIRGTFTQGQASLPFHLGRDAVKPPRRPQEPQPPFPYPEEEVTYQNGGVRLAGTLTLPPGSGPFPAVLLITGSGAQNRNEELLGHKPFLVLADHLTRAGIAVLRVDDRGVAGSTGDSNATSADFAEDALAGVRFLKGHARIAKDRIGLLGHSEGGLIAPLAASRSTDVAFIILFAGSGVPGFELLPAQVEALNLAGGMSAVQARKEGELTRAAVGLVRAEKDDDALRTKLTKLIQDHPDAVSPQDLAAVGGMEAFIAQQMKFFSNPWARFFLDYDPRPALRKVRVPVLAVNGELDKQVLVDQNLPAIERALREGKNPDVTVRRMPGLNHLFQTATTGSTTEYAQIEETMSPAVLDLVTRWILQRFGKKPGA